MSHSTVVRRVESLESELGARLFDRSRDGYTLTEIGRQMLPGSERVEQEMSALERELSGRDERLAGSVVLTCSDSFVSSLLIEALTPFLRDYPGIELSITTDSRPFDLARREADIAVRALSVGAQPPETLIGLKLVPVVLASYVATAHAARLDPELDGASPRWLSIEDRKLHDPLIAQTSYPDVPAWGSFSSLELLVQAARAGLGLVMLPTYVGDRELGLRRLARPDLRHMGDLWLLSHPDLRDNARLRATRARVAQALRDRGQLFSVGCPAGAPGRLEIAPDGSRGGDVR